MNAKTNKIDNYPEIFPKSSDELRNWLMENHLNSVGVWIRFSKVASGKRSIVYSDLVDELLCFGWIDSTIRPIDEHHYKQLITPRKPKSVWSKVNKAKIEKLQAEKRMHSNGEKSVETAQQNGSWTILDSVENLEIPKDLQMSFDENPQAKTNYLSKSPSKQKQYLYGLVLIKTETARKSRIEKIINDLIK
ncbi:MAG: YdeI/OmpD-associated family protein [Flavobacteriaceae bacterium]|jgi:uncharacterized protein YdeI (YjbR/CyaY-like superfamily)|nr:YdeI/OmpD-associated family protein [Flavobacteriaceae bacterium]